MAIDGFRFVGGATRKLMQAWMDREPDPRPIPWAPLGKPLAALRVAFVSTAAISRRDDPPFDLEGERRNPWWGDPTHRVLRRTDREPDVRVEHTHIDTRPGSQDLDCLLPLRRLDELVEAGVVGASAPHHYSIMGYILKTERLLEETAPAIAAGLRRDEVDLALLVPV